MDLWLLMSLIMQESKQMAAVSIIFHNTGSPILALCYDSTRGLLAFSFSGEIQIWCLRVNKAHRRQWVLECTIPCQRDGVTWSASTLSFFGGYEKSLFVGTKAGIA